MFPALQPHRPTVSPPHSRSHVSGPHQQIRYDSSTTHPVFFTSRLGKPGFTAGAAEPEAAGWSPVAQGYLLKKEDGGVKL